LSAILLDLDQTIVNTLERFFLVFNMTLEHYGLESIGWNVFLEHYSNDSLDLFIPPTVSRRDFWWFFLKSYNDVIAPSDAPIPGAEDVLKLLKNKGLKVGVITGRAVNEDIVWEELSRYGLSDYIDLLLTRLSIPPSSTDDVISKTSLFKLALSIFRIVPEECVVVGDYWADMVAGREIGARLVIGVLTGLMSPEKLKKHGAHVVINSIIELPSILGIT